MLFASLDFDESLPIQYVAFNNESSEKKKTDGEKIFLNFVFSIRFFKKIKLPLKQKFPRAFLLFRQAVPDFVERFCSIDMSKYPE